MDQMVITNPTQVKNIVLVKYMFVSKLLCFINANKFPANIAPPTPSSSKLIVTSRARGSSISYIMIFVMDNTKEIVEIFNKYEVSKRKNFSDYQISELDGITNNSFAIEVDGKKYVLRLPGDNPDEINRKAEKINSTLAYESNLTLPFLIFDDENGIKISEFFDIYTYTQKDFLNSDLRVNAINKLKELHEADIAFEENFNPLKVFKNLVDTTNHIESEALELGNKLIEKISAYGIFEKPCHNDLYHANFVIFQDKTYLIDWEYSSMGDPFFDFADLFWQNEFDLDPNLRRQSLEEIGVLDSDSLEKFELFEIISMITWGLWANKKNKNGEETLLKAINLGKEKFS